MRVFGLDGKQYAWVPASRPRGAVSSYHLKARELLAEEFPMITVMEEVALPGSGNLSADFYVPMKRLLVEVQGQQHTEYNHHMHQGQKTNFYKSVKRDERKRQWCELNNITYVELSYGEDLDGWRGKIRQR